MIEIQFPALSFPVILALWSNLLREHINASKGMLRLYLENINRVLVDDLLVDAYFLRKHVINWHF
jgi:hypothetical protein